MKTNERVKIAKAFQKQINKLQREREKLFTKALRTLKVPDTNQAWDYLMNDQQGYSTFLEGLK
jgi:mRNA-degrading endonuclease RelE of RelBE toxin-antitoxin system